MIYYFTFNDQPSGIYSSQVLDTLKFLRKISNSEIRLIAFFPKANFEKNKSIVLKEEPDAIVLKMVFGISRWRWHKFLLKFKLRNKGSRLICRGPLAAAMAIEIGYDKVIYDGRAAVKAEVEEYDVTMGNLKLGEDFIKAERKAVLKASYRVAVSNQLVKYWQSEIGYEGEKHVIIPCTLNSNWISEKIEDSSVDDTGVRLVYSGGTGPWQSFELVVGLVRSWLNRYDSGSVLFLTRENDLIRKLKEEFPQRVVRKFVSHDEVKTELSSCDYGILIREDRVTNQVASPVKFAEYLSAGLHVLISTRIGDFSKLVEENSCGEVVANEIPNLQKVGSEEKDRALRICKSHFQKKLFVDEYKKILNV